MMQAKYYFISGLPYLGSTLLTALLLPSQFHVGVHGTHFDPFAFFKQFPEVVL
jgi:hypothetical protein